jgi:acetyltransferase-like isoleucine patch superfamily enzyme
MKPMRPSKTRVGKVLLHAALALSPRWVKVPIYRRVFGFKIDPSAVIGASILDVDELEVGPHVRIGHGNLFTCTKRVHIGDHSEIGYMNIIRGGDEVTLGAYATILRFNVLNAMLDQDCTNPTDSRLVMDQGSYLVSGHRLDFSDRIHLGKNVIVAGRGSSLWTHNRQATSPIEIGDHSYLGSEVRVAPGASLGPMSILGMGAVLTGKHEGGQVVAGVPAKPLRAIDEEDERVLLRKSRLDIPGDLY